MNKLTADIARRHMGNLKEHRANPKAGLSIREELYLQALEIALPVLEQQEKGNDGWIEWKGNGPTISILGKAVEVRFQDNDTDAGPSRHFYWGSNCGNRIIAYRVIENDGREG